MALPLAALLAAGTGAVKAGIGAYQTIKGAGMKPQRPTYERPEEVKKLIERKRAAAGGGSYPGQGRDEERLQSLMARQVEQARELGGDPFSSMAAISRAGQQQVEGQRDIRQVALQDKIRRGRELDSAERVGASEARKEFELNKLDPYKAAAATKSALSGAGIQNITAGVSDVAGAFSEAARLKEPNKTDATSDTTTGANEILGGDSQIRAQELNTERVNADMQQKRAAFERLKAQDASLVGVKFEKWLQNKR